MTEALVTGPIQAAVVDGTLGFTPEEFDELSEQAKSTTAEGGWFEGCTLVSGSDEVDEIEE